MLFDKALIDVVYGKVSEEEKQAFMFRRSGRSTSLALRYLSEAIASPKSEIKIQDHFGSVAADKMLMSMIGDIAETLGFQHIKFNKSKLTICFDWDHPLQKFLKEKGTIK